MYNSAELVLLFSLCLGFVEEVPEQSPRLAQVESAVSLSACLLPLLPAELLAVFLYFPVDSAIFLRRLLFVRCWFHLLLRAIFAWMRLANLLSISCMSSSVSICVVTFSVVSTVAFVTMPA